MGTERAMDKGAESELWESLDMRTQDGKEWVLDADGEYEATLYRLGFTKLIVSMSPIEAGVWFRVVGEAERVGEEDDYAPNAEEEMARHREWPGFEDALDAAVKRARGAGAEAKTTAELGPIWEEAIHRARWRSVDRYVDSRMVTLGGTIYGWTKVAEETTPTARLLVVEGVPVGEFPTEIDGVRILVTPIPPVHLQ